MYRQWLYWTCKWATLGLDSNEFNHWQDLTTQLDKHCPDCEEGYVCMSCKNNGLKLTTLETMLLKNIEMSLDTHRTTEKTH